MFDGLTEIKLAAMLTEIQFVACTYTAHTKKCFKNKLRWQTFVMSGCLSEFYEIAFSLIWHLFCRSTFYTLLMLFFFTLLVCCFLGIFGFNFKYENLLALSFSNTMLHRLNNIHCK